MIGTSWHVTGNKHHFPNQGPVVSTSAVSSATTEFGLTTVIRKGRTCVVIVVGMARQSICGNSRQGIGRDVIKCLPH